MKNTKIIVLVIVLVLLIAGATYFFVNKGKDAKEKLQAPEVPNNPNEGLRDSELLAPAPSVNPQPNPNPQQQEQTRVVSTTSAEGRAAIHNHATIIERTPQTNSKVRKRYNIGEKLFDGIPADAADVIKESFAVHIQGLDKNNLMEYPIYGTYTKPALRSELLDFVKTYKSQGVKLDKMNTSTAVVKGWLPSLNYNLVTGKDRQGINGEADTTYFKRANNIQSLTVGGMLIVKFAENWISEIDRFNEMVEREAINKAIQEGWKFEGYAAPTTDSL